MNIDTKLLKKNISKWNSAMYKRNYMQWQSGVYSSHVSKTKYLKINQCSQQKSYYIIKSIDTKKDFDKVEHLWKKKNGKIEIERNFDSLIMGIYTIPKVTYSEMRENSFSFILGTKQVGSLLSLLLDITQNSSQ